MLGNGPHLRMWCEVVMKWLLLSILSMLLILIMKVSFISGMLIYWLLLLSICKFLVVGRRMVKYS